MQTFAEEFRHAAQARLTGKRSPGRYSNRLRHLALSHLAEVRKDGGKASQAARDLGLDPNTLRGWERTSRPGVPAARGVGALVPVVVRDGPDTVFAQGAPFVVRGFQNVTIECQRAVDVAALLRALA